MSRRLTINKTWDGRPSVAAPYKAVFSINAMTGDVVVAIDAPFFNDPLPPMEPDDDDASLSPYLEIQVGPHGHYNLAFFLQEGDFQNMDTSLSLEQPPVPKINNKSGRWSVEVGVPSFFLPEPVCGDDLSITWMVNAYAIHGTGEKREFLAHSPVPGTNPNFHQLRCFVPLVLFETLETRQTIDRSSMAVERIRQSSIAGGYQHTPTAAAAMGLASGAGQTHDLTRRLMQEVSNTPGGLKGVVGTDGDGNSSDEEGKGPPSSVFRADHSSQSDAGDNPDMQEAVARQIKALGIRLDDLDEKFAKHLQPSVKLLQKTQSEYSLMHAYVTKRSGLSIKSRMLILTSKARMIYCDMHGAYKGMIPWSVTKPISAVLISSKKFQVVLHDKSRKYHFTDPLGAQRWVDVINLFTKAQKDYLKATMAK